MIDALKQRKHVLLLGLLVTLGLTAGLSTAATADGHKNNPKKIVVAGERSVNDQGQPASDKFNPANRKQTSLEEAATSQRGAGAGQAAPLIESGEKKPQGPPVSEARGKTRRSNAAPAKRATGQPGCVVGYGTGGECLPVTPPSHAAHTDHSMEMAWTCAEVRTLFKDGVSVSKGKDKLKLDSNKDGVACGTGDA